MVDWIHDGAFRSLPDRAESARLTRAGDRAGFDVELIAGDTVVASCKAAEYWELVAQQLASAPHGDDPLAEPEARHALASKITRRVKESGVSQAVARTTDLAIGVYPLATAVGIGTRLVRSRIRTGREQSDALRRLGFVLRSLRAQADGELVRGQLGR